MDMGLIKPPRPDATLTPFRDGVGVLRREGAVAGHIMTTVTEFWSPGSPLRLQWWVWYIVIWADGTREQSTEDYPPWLTVDEMRHGRFTRPDGVHSGDYEFAWLDAEEGAAVRSQLGVLPGGF
ncbi:hypothetical protein [Microbacterium sp.]|uniref:hypothetical protein n=1 Tax=Microbacterium sp. TaxID=51671 RepID=UPI0039E48259